MLEQSHQQKPFNKAVSNFVDWLKVSNRRKRGVHTRHRRTPSGLHEALQNWKELGQDALWPSMGWKALARYVLLKVRRSAADPHHVAMGMAIGMWANFLPLPGLGGLLSVSFAWLLRANMMSAFIGQLLGNAWTMPFIWWLCYKTGLLVFPLNEHGVGFHELLANANLEYILENWRMLARGVLLPLTVGGQILAIPAALLSYWLTHWEVKRFWAYRRKVREANRHKNEHLKKPKQKQTA